MSKTVTGDAASEPGAGSFTRQSGPMTLHNFADTVSERCPRPLLRARVTTLQVNVGLRCDLACHHCHVEAGPRRTETMAHRTADRRLALLAAKPEMATLYLAGGAS